MKLELHPGTGATIFTETGEVYNESIRTKKPRTESVPSGTRVEGPPRITGVTAGDKW